MRLRTEFIYREVRLRVKWKYPVPKFVPMGFGIVAKNGHVSLYAITEETAKRIQLSGSIRGWMPIHYSSVVWIDVDDFASGDEVEQRCKELDLFYARYFSGSKGWHFAIKRAAQPDGELYAKDRVFVRKHFHDLSAFRHFDLSIYHPMHLLRGVGSIHEKSRKRKVLVSFHRGKNIPDVSDYIPDTITKSAAIHYQQNFGDDSWANVRNLMCFHNGHEGSRYLALWRLAKDLVREGLSSTQVRSIVEVYNGSFENPHECSEIERAVSDAEKAVKAEWGCTDSTYVD